MISHVDLLLKNYTVDGKRSISSAGTSERLEEDAKEGTNETKKTELEKTREFHHNKRK